MIGARASAVATSAPRARSAYKPVDRQARHPGLIPAMAAKRKPLPFKPQGPPWQAGFWQGSFCKQKGDKAASGGNSDPEEPWPIAWPLRIVASPPVCPRFLGMAVFSGPSYLAGWSRGIFRHSPVLTWPHPAAASCSAWLGSAYGSGFRPAEDKPGSTLGFEQLAVKHSAAARPRSGPWARAAAAKNTSGGLSRANHQASVRSIQEANKKPMNVSLVSAGGFGSRLGLAGFCVARGGGFGLIG